ncbi:MAG TPA: transposase, partial [Verrucomicrobiae bacterium]|nr:transposase [Verrucomicrobiae bacterium]
NGIPLSVVISSASTHDIKLVTDVVDNRVIKRQRQCQLPFHKPKLRTRKRRLQHLCLDKAYKSKTEEQELIKPGYVLHIPYKKKKGKEVDNEKTTTIPNRKKHSPKRWVAERINSWHNRFRKLFTRYEKKVENYLGLVQLSCGIIIYRKIILG